MHQKFLKPNMVLLLVTLFGLVVSGLFFFSQLNEVQATNNVPGLSSTSKSSFSQDGDLITLSLSPNTPIKKVDISVHNISCALAFSNTNMGGAVRDKALIDFCLSRHSPHPVTNSECDVLVSNLLRQHQNPRYNLIGDCIPDRISKDTEEVCRTDSQLESYFNIDPFNNYNHPAITRILNNARSNYAAGLPTLDNHNVIAACLSQNMVCGWYLSAFYMESKPIPVSVSSNCLNYSLDRAKAACSAITDRGGAWHEIRPGGGKAAEGYERNYGLNVRDFKENVALSHFSARKAFNHGNQLCFRIQYQDGSYEYALSPKFDNSAPKLSFARESNKIIITSNNDNDFSDNNNSLSPEQNNWYFGYDNAALNASCKFSDGRTSSELRNPNNDNYYSPTEVEAAFEAGKRFVYSFEGNSVIIYVNHRLIGDSARLCIKVEDQYGNASKAKRLTSLNLSQEISEEISTANNNNPVDIVPAQPLEGSQPIQKQRQNYSNGNGNGNGNDNGNNGNGIGSSGQQSTNDNQADQPEEDEAQPTDQPQNGQTATDDGISSLSETQILAQGNLATNNSVNQNSAETDNDLASTADQSTVATTPSSTPDSDIVTKDESSRAGGLAAVLTILIVILSVIVCLILIRHKRQT